MRQITSYTDTVLSILAQLALANATVWDNSLAGRLWTNAIASTYWVSVELLVYTLEGAVVLPLRRMVDESRRDSGLGEASSL